MIQCIKNIGYWKMSNKKWKKRKSPKKTSLENPFDNINVNNEEELRKGLGQFNSLIKKELTLQQLAGIKDSDVDAIMAAGVLLYEQGRYREAEDIFRGAVLLNSNSALAHSALGTVLTAQGKNDEALIQLSEAIRLNPRDIAAYANRGEVYLKYADFKSASEDLKKAVELDPDQADPAANRARAIIVEINRVIGELQSQIDQGKEPTL